MNWLDKIGRWFELVIDWRAPYQSLSVEDIPDNLENRIIYLIGEVNRPWSASFNCPCGCEEVISLSLISTDRPRWRITHNKDERITLYPSVNKIKGCKSHFFIKNGKVIWVKSLTPGYYLI